MQFGKSKQISPARRLALEVLRRVEAEGAFATLALDHALQRRPLMLPEDRALGTELVYGTIRWRRRLDYALAAHSHRPVERIDASVLRILRLAAYQILFLDRVPAYAAVDQATEMAAQLRGQRLAGFVNGVLRGLASAKEHIEWPDPAQDLAHALSVMQSMPDWMVGWWLKLFGPERAEAFMKACNQPPVMWVRTNTLRVSPEGLRDLLSASGLDVAAAEHVPGASRVAGLADVRSLAAHEAGLLHIQEAAAQAVCHLLEPRPGLRVLDACAAPGGKTATLAELMEDRGQILAVDVHPARLGLVRRLLDRLGITCVETVAVDLSQPLDRDWGTFDRILLDAPCSALGVLRRHPEGKWSTAPEDLQRLSRVQKQLLDQVALLLKPGGSLVYSVCTFTEEEGPGLIREWLEGHPEFERVDPRKGKRQPWHTLVDAEGALRTWPDLHDLDGFYAVRLMRKEPREA
jgi:16S rRNA (cytosine967-C5)-methyltransferase